MSDFYSKNNISKLYAYKEIPKDRKTVEFGWIPCDRIEDPTVVISRNPHTPENDSAVSLVDYSKYFSSFTGFSPEKFWTRWKHSPEEFQKYWLQAKPEAESHSHEFVMKLAALIVERTPFEHQFPNRLINFQVVDVENGSAGSTS